MMNYLYLQGSPSSRETVEFQITGYDGLPTTCVVDVDMLLCGVKFAPCGNGDDIRLSDEHCLEILKVVKQEREKISAKCTCKSMKDWMDSGMRTFEDFFSVGDVVDEDVVDHFVNILPPTVMRSNLVQVGEAFSMAYDEEKKQQRSIFCTFARESGVWKFVGYCFVGETTNRHAFCSKLYERMAVLQKAIQMAC